MCQSTFGELKVVVADNRYAAAPRVEKVENGPGKGSQGRRYIGNRGVHYLPLCLLWVISGHNGPFASCPLHPR